MKIKVAKTIVVLSAVLALGQMVTGCSSTSAKEAETVADETDVESKTQGEPENKTINQDESVEQQENSAGRWHVLAPDVAAAVDADFEGVVWKIDADSFYIAESTTEILENGIILGSSPSADAEIPDSELIQVVFDADTYFYIRTLYDEGARYEDTAAGFADLETDVSVEMKGEFVNDVFHADEIRIIRVSK